jgi:DNA-binding NarL/FixJ family response regulator
MAQSLPHASSAGLPRVVIVDDHAPFRRTIAILLAARGYDVVAEASCAATAVDAVERHAADAVLMDVGLRDDDAFAVCRLLTRSRPELAVLLTSADGRHDAQRIRRSGARGFVRKSRLHQIDLGKYWPRESIADGPRNAHRPETHPDAPHSARVLVVDDKDVFRSTLLSILEAEGFDVAAAPDGETAIERVPRFQPDVVVMDVQMPGISGIEATRRLLRVAPHTAVVILSLFTDPEITDLAARAGAFACLRKDAPLDEMVSAIEAAARRRHERWGPVPSPG